MIGAGVVGLKYTFQIVGFTGKPSWIEYRMGSGSTYTVYKLISVLIALWGILYLTNTSHFITDPIGNSLRNIFRLPNSQN